MPQNEVVYMCPEEQLSIVCSTNQTYSYLEWAIRIPPTSYYLRSQWISASSHVSNYLWRRTGDTTINYTKNSEPGVLPLISTLLIDSVTTSFNGTMITCNEFIHVSDNYSLEAILIMSIYLISGKVELMQAVKFIYLI